MCKVALKYLKTVHNPCILMYSGNNNRPKPVCFTASDSNRSTLNWNIIPPPLQVWSQADQSGIRAAESLQQWHQGGALWVPHGGWYWGRQCERIRPEGHLQTHQGGLQEDPGRWLYPSDDGWGRLEEKGECVCRFFSPSRPIVKRLV